MTNEFEGRPAAWLLERRTALQDILGSPAGSQTHVGIQQGVFHEFAEMSRAELRQTLRSIRYALWCLDPDTYTNPLTEKVMTVFTDHS